MPKKAVNNASETAEKPSFFVRIMFRQNTSWQGEIQWLDGMKTRSFRSLLELVMLMEEAVELSKGLEVSYKIRSWNDSENEGEEGASCPDSTQS